jgi:DnaK suppressor protein
MTPRDSTTPTAPGLREHLDAERQRILDRLAQMSSLMDPSNWWPHLKDGAADAGSVATTRDTAASVQHQALQRLAQVDEALRRLDDGTYGTCAVCGSAIPKSRLDAVPYAITCVDHPRASRYELADATEWSTT